MEMEGEWGVHEASEVTILLISVDATQEHACMKSHEAAPWVELTFLVQLILQQKVRKI